MHRDEPLIADRQPAIAGEPGERPFDNPAVSPEVGLGLDALPSDAVLDAPGDALVTTAAIVIALIGVHLGRPVTRSPAPARLQRWDRIQHRAQHPTVMAVRGGYLDGERDPGAVDHKVLLRARFALVCGVPADRAPPFSPRGSASRWPRDSSRCGRPPRAARVARSAASSIRHGAATRGAGASRSPRSRSPSRSVASATGFRCAARRGCRSASHGRRSTAGRPSAGGAAWAGGARPPSKVHPTPEASCLQPTRHRARL